VSPVRVLLSARAYGMARPRVDACLTRRLWYVGGSTLMCGCLAARLIAPWTAASVPLMIVLAFSSSTGAAIAAIAVKGIMHRRRSARRDRGLACLAPAVGLSGAFVWIYARGVEAKPWMAQGVRFGVAVALLTIVPSYLIYFVVQPMPGGVVIKQIIFDGVLLVILGTIVAWLYRGAATRA
jgi:hypothetical protein